MYIAISVITNIKIASDKLLIETHFDNIYCTILKPK